MNKRGRFLLDIQFFARDDTQEKTEPKVSTVPKVQFDKVASELAAKNKKLKALEEKYQLEIQEKETEIAKLRAEIAKEKVLATLTTRGIDQKKAQRIADKGISVEVALEIASLFAEINENHKCEIEQVKLDNTTKPNGGGNDKSATKDDDKKMTLRYTFGLPAYCYFYDTLVQYEAHEIKKCFDRAFAEVIGAG